MKINNKIKKLFLMAVLGLFLNTSLANASISVAEAFYTLAHQNNTQKIEKLLHRGYSIDSAGQDGLNPVCIAVSKNDKKAYSILTDYGAQKKPKCLKNISKQAYKRFFGTNPYTPNIPVYESDTPYNTGAILLGTTAVVAAVALKGSTDGGGSGGGNNDGSDDKDDKDDNDNSNDCPNNSTYNKTSKKCECNQGYGNYGDSKQCYKDIENCKTQQKAECKKCNDGYTVYNGKCVLPSDCPENSVYVPSKNTCECNSGYGHYGDARECYATIPNCVKQTKDSCSSCSSNYLLDGNMCYEKINKCKEGHQNKDICSECEEGYGIHNGDGRVCYKNIDKCEVQVKDICNDCKEGYGTHGDPYNCYQDVENCSVYNPVNYSMCMECNKGYITKGDGRCYDENYCKDYPHSVPVNDTCVCDASKGYTGDPYDGDKGCTQADDGDYQEGDGNHDQWSNLNDKYCNSQGIYQIESGLCICYAGYTGSDCSSCSQEKNEDGTNKYIAIDSRCYINLNCKQDEGYIQSYNQCICREGFLPLEGKCIKQINCGKGKEQVIISEDPEIACQCKANFVKNEETGECICPTEEGFIEDLLTDSCMKPSKTCEEENENGDKWTGENCDICPAEYKITEDETGERCGLACADNRKPNIDEASGALIDCNQCADGYIYNKVANNCIIAECEDGVNGYIKVDGLCLCDESKGYAMSLKGMCELKKDSLIGIADTNINNGIINLENQTEHRDIYGMKPILEMGENGNITYYDSIYNALNYKDAEINITNSNTGSISIYGMYSPSVLYNSATTNDIGDTASKGTITIKDSASSSKIYGMMNSEGMNNIYNSFSYNTNIAGSNNTSEGIIKITKEETSNGEIIGIQGYNNIYNAYAGTQGGIGANSTANGNIKIEHKGIGNIVGIKNTSVAGKITNAYAYLDSAISDALAIGTITLEGKSGVYGIMGSAIIVNSETQFQKHYNMINNFGSTGTINVTSHSGAKGEGAYGIYSPQNSGEKADIYNAMGYNSKGTINVSNTEGGSVYGIYSENEKYVDRDENGNIKTDETGASMLIYNNIYNAFRSSQVYGGENSTSTGKINLNISGGSESDQSAIGIYAKGDAFNSYINSGSDTMLKAYGEIYVYDKSATSVITIKGIEAAGDKIANAYAQGSNLNTSSLSEGLIHIIKSGIGNSSTIAGMFSDKPNYSKGVSIYNAALENDRSNVKGTVKIEVKSSPKDVYGIYAEKGATDGQLKTVYNAYYSNDTIFDTEEEKKAKVEGVIDVAVTSPAGGETKVYGIYVKDSIAYNAYVDVPNGSVSNANVIGTINVKSAGGGGSGEVIGMNAEGENGRLYNNGYNSFINVEALNDGNLYYVTAYGMKSKNGYIENDGNINVKVSNAKNKTTNAFGIYSENGIANNYLGGKINVEGNNNNFGMYSHVTKDFYSVARIYNGGEINVSGGVNNYGMYAKIEDDSTGKIEVENDGIINIKGNGVGIYASGEGVTITNKGSIKINTQDEATSIECEGDDCKTANNAIILNGATYKEAGETESEKDINFDTYGGEVVLASTGSFKTKEEISGNLYVDTSTITDTFDTVTTLNDAISAKNVDDLQLKSKSYMYDASVIKNQNSNYDVTMNMKDFKDITSSNMANYFTKNYEQKTNSTLFNALKQAENKQQFNETLKNITGNYVLPNITEEELKVARSLDNKMIQELFKDNNQNIRRFVGADTLFIGRDKTDSLTGYELDSQSMYALYDKKINNRYRLGLGLSFTHTDTDYDNDSSRKNFSVQGYVPLTYNLSNNLILASIARLGYQDGEYTRYGYNNKIYKADENAINYGLLNEIRYKLNVGSITLSPFIGLNAIGWYYDSLDERGEDLALTLASSHIFSLESAIGLYLDFDKEINDVSKITTTLGLGYYHEFSNPYNQREAQIANTIGHYKLKNTAINQRDRGVISAKVKYDYKDLSIYGEFMQYLEEEYPLSLDLGLQYKF